MSSAQTYLRASEVSRPSLHCFFGVNLRCLAERIPGAQIRHRDEVNYHQPRAQFAINNSSHPAELAARSKWATVKLIITESWSSKTAFATLSCVACCCCCCRCFGTSIQGLGLKLIRFRGIVTHLRLASSLLNLMIGCSKMSQSIELDNSSDR